MRVVYVVGCLGNAALQADCQPCALPNGASVRWPAACRLHAPMLRWLGRVPVRWGFERYLAILGRPMSVCLTQHVVLWKMAVRRTIAVSLIELFNIITVTFIVRDQRPLGKLCALMSVILVFFYYYLHQSWRRSGPRMQYNIRRGF